MKDKVLCLEDDLTIQTLVEASLPDFDVVSVKTIKEAEKILATSAFCALLIDIQLPDGDGLRFLASLSQKDGTKKIPVLILSDHAAIANKVMAFSFGAEDFIAKPFDPLELNARVSAKVRRSQGEKQGDRHRKLGDLLLDFDRQLATRQDVKNLQEENLNLTSIELKILSLLTRRLEQVFSRDQIMSHVWGETFISDRTVDSHIAHLRQKIAKTQVQVETAKNFGYRAVLNTMKRSD